MQAYNREVDLVRIERELVLDAMLVERLKAFEGSEFASVNVELTDTPSLRVGICPISTLDEAREHEILKDLPAALGLLGGTWHRKFGESMGEFYWTTTRTWRFEQEGKEVEYDVVLILWRAALKGCKVVEVEKLVKCYESICPESTEVLS
jgi:hypothetical protein